MGVSNKSVTKCYTWYKQNEKPYIANNVRRQQLCTAVNIGQYGLTGLEAKAFRKTVLFGGVGNLEQK